MTENIKIELDINFMPTQLTSLVSPCLAFGSGCQSAFGSGSYQALHNSPSLPSTAYISNFSVSGGHLIVTLKP